MVAAFFDLMALLLFGSGSAFLMWTAADRSTHPLLRGLLYGSGFAILCATAISAMLWGLV